MAERGIGGRSAVGSQQVTGHVTGPPESAAASVTGPPESAAASLTGPPESTAPSVTGPPESTAPSVTGPPESTAPSVTGPPESAAPSSGSRDEHADASKTADTSIMAGQSRQGLGLAASGGRPLDPLRPFITAAARSELRASIGITAEDCKTRPR